jgi:hypothetical protein
MAMRANLAQQIEIAMKYRYYRPVRVLVCVAALLAVLHAEAWAEDESVAAPDDNVRICEAYGPGYTVVPGTNTCIKINGFVRQDLNISVGGSGPPAPSPAQPPN